MSDVSEFLTDLWGFVRQGDPTLYVSEYAHNRVFKGTSHEEEVDRFEKNWKNEQVWSRDPIAQAIVTYMAGTLGIPIPMSVWEEYNKWWDGIGAPPELADFGKSLFIYLWAFFVIMAGIFIYRKVI